MTNAATPSHITDLITLLSDDASAVRERARKALASLGANALPALTRALFDTNKHVRWEAASALLEIHDPSSAAALVRALDDEESSVRWIAAEALIKIGLPGLTATLEGLIEHAPSSTFQESAAHVLKHMPQPEYIDILAPVLVALDGPAKRSEAPVAALHAMDALRAHGVRTV